MIPVTVNLEELPNDTFLNIAQIARTPTRNKNPNRYIPIFQISRGTWERGVKSGKFPQPKRLPNGQCLWRAGDIKALIAEMEGNA